MTGTTTQQGNRGRNTIRLAMLLALLLFIGLPTTQAQGDGPTWQEVRKLLANDGAAGDGFGRSVSLSGNRALIGARWDDDNGQDSGSAYVFDVTSGQQLHKLTPSDGAADDRFGFSVSLSGDHALIGAYGDDDYGSRSGSAYVFDVTTGQQLHKLTPSDGAAGDYFGHAVALSGDRALIGAQLDDDYGSRSGSAYVFDITTGQQLHKLTPTDGAAGDFFGWSVALSGDRALIGAWEDDDNGQDSGSAYVFDVTSGQQLHKLTASDGAAGDGFGFSVSLSGNWALIGAPYDGEINDNGQDRGSAYVFDVTSGQQLHKLTASDDAAGDYFGYAVALSGDRALIGAWGDDDNGSNSGSAYVFDVTSGQQLHKLRPSDGAIYDWFGYAVSLSGDRALIGAPDDSGSSSGSAYVFELLYPVDINGDGMIDTKDVVIVLYYLGQPGAGDAAIADVDGDGLVTPVDAIYVINRLSP